MDENTKSQSHSINGHSHLIININININQDNNNNNNNVFNVPQNSSERDNIQVNININCNSFQKSSSLVTIAKSFSDKCLQTDNIEYKLSQENHKSIGESVDLTVSLNKTGDDDTTKETNSKVKINNEKNREESHTGKSHELEKDQFDPIITSTLQTEKPTGLQNSGDDCYKNAIIQAMASSEILIQKLNDLKETKSIKSKCLDYFFEILDFVNKQEKTTENQWKNMDYLEMLTKFIVWKKPHQQDPFDFLSVLGNKICEDFKQDKNFDFPLKYKLLHTFKGIRLSNKIQEHLGLSLNLCEDNVLVEMIYQYFGNSIIDNDNNKTTKINLYKKPPEIHIQANKADNEGDMFKPEYNIKYEEEMSLKIDIVEDNSGKNSSLHEIDYQLRSIVHHQGNINDGHYIAYRKWQDNWYSINDRIVELIDENKDPITDICPYILIYDIKKS